MNKYDSANDSEYLGITEAAEYLRVSASTLRRWEKKGFLIPERTPTGIRRYTKKQLDKALISDPQSPEPAIQYTQNEDNESIVEVSKTDVVDTQLPDIEPLNQYIQEVEEPTYTQPVHVEKEPERSVVSQSVHEKPLFFEKKPDVVSSPTPESNFISVTPQQDLAGFDFAKLLKDAELPEFEVPEKQEVKQTTEKYVPPSPFLTPTIPTSDSAKVFTNPSPVREEKRFELNDDRAVEDTSDDRKKRSRLMMSVVFSLALLCVLAVFFAFFWYFNSSNESTELLNPIVN